MPISKKQMRIIQGMTPEQQEQYNRAAIGEGPWPYETCLACKGTGDSEEIQEDRRGNEYKAPCRTCKGMAIVAPPMTEMETFDKKQIVERARFLRGQERERLRKVGECSCLPISFIENFIQNGKPIEGPCKDVLCPKHGGEW